MTATPDEQRTAALARTNFYFFVMYAFRHLFPEHPPPSGRYLEAMCRAIQDVIEGKRSQLLITIPPRHLKSTCVSVALPAWLLGLHPDKEMMVATYNQEFARLHSSQFRGIIESDWYKGFFPHVVIARGQNRVDEIRTTRGGARKAVTIGAAPTGRGAHVLITDDLLNASDAQSETERQRAKTFFEEGLYSRLNDKADPKIISVQQRLHEDDFAAYLIEKGTFDHLNMPAIAQRDEALQLYQNREFNRAKGEALSPDREPLEALEKTRLSIGEYAFACQYLQDPIPRGSALVDFAKIATCDEPPDRELCAPVVQSWDPAFVNDPTADFSVCTTLGRYEGKWYLLDVWRNRKDFSDLIGLIPAWRDRWSADKVIIEYDGSGKALVGQCRKAGHRYVIGKKTGSKSKEERLIDESARMTSGTYVIPNNAPWYAELRHEFRAFPNGRYDDQVDSLTQAVAWIEGIQGRSLINRDPVTKRRRRPKSKMRKLAFG